MENGKWKIKNGQWIIKNEMMVSNNEIINKLMNSKNTDR
jgi:hypothetical protein